MKNYRPLDDLEMHELLQLIYPEHIRGDDDEYFEISQDACEQPINLGDDFEVTLADLLGRVVMLSMPMRGELTGTLRHCLGAVTFVNGEVQMRAAVQRKAGCA